MPKTPRKLQASGGPLTVTDKISNLMMGSTFASVMICVIISVVLTSVVLLESAAKNHVNADRHIGEIIHSSRRARAVSVKLGSTNLNRLLKENPVDAEDIIAADTKLASDGSGSGDAYCSASVEFKKERDVSGNYTIVCGSLTTPARTFHTLVSYGDTWGFDPTVLEQAPVLWMCRVQAPSSPSCAVEFVAWANLANQGELKAACTKCSYKVMSQGIFLHEAQAKACVAAGDGKSVEVEVTRQVYQDKWPLIGSFSNC